MGRSLTRGTILPLVARYNHGHDVMDVMTMVLTWMREDGAADSDAPLYVASILELKDAEMATS